MVAQDVEVTRVVFRVWKEKEGGVLALFPDILENGQGSNCVLSYEHTGQHGAADYPGCIRNTRPAIQKEYKPLLKELEAIGYRLKVVERR